MTNMSEAFVTEIPKRVHRYWWTCVPALPAQRQSRAYESLKRVWFDHTMNTFKNFVTGQRYTNGRCFYREGNEDHVGIALLQNWAILPGASWAWNFLVACGANPIGEVKRTAWCHSFEQQPDIGKGIRIADFVISWEDEAGEAVLVIETKVRKGKLSKKDLLGGDYYLSLPSIRPMDRRFYALLVDQPDVDEVRWRVPEGTSVLSWQALAGLQVAAISELQIPPQWLDRVLGALVGQFRYFDFEPETCVQSLSSDDLSDLTYEEARAANLPQRVERFLLGSIAQSTARRGETPTAPDAWLAEEPDCLRIYLQQQQTTADRRIPRWRLGWRS